MKYSLVLLIVLLVDYSNAQSRQFTPEMVARKFLETLTTSDTSVARDLIYSSLQLKTILIRPGQEPSLHSESSAGLIDAIGTPHEEQWEERSDEYITVEDSTLAVVSCDYEFFVDGKFSHRGMNVFQMMRTSDGWKIFAITDTRYLSEE